MHYDMHHDLNVRCFGIKAALKASYHKISKWPTSVPGVYSIWCVHGVWETDLICLQVGHNGKYYSIILQGGYRWCKAQEWDGTLLYWKGILRILVQISMVPCSCTYIFYGQQDELVLLILMISNGHSNA